MVAMTAAAEKENDDTQSVIKLMEFKFLNKVLPELTNKLPFILNENLDFKDSLLYFTFYSKRYLREIFTPLLDYIEKYDEKNALNLENLKITKELYEKSTLQFVNLIKNLLKFVNYEKIPTNLNIIKNKDFWIKSITDAFKAEQTKYLQLKIDQDNVIKTLDFEIDLLNEELLKKEEFLRKNAYKNENEFKELKSQIKKLEIDRDSEIFKKEKSIESLKKLENQITQLNNNLQEKEYNISNLQIEIENLRKINLQHEDEITKLKNLKAKSEQEINETYAKITQIENLLSEKIKENENLQISSMETFVAKTAQEKENEIKIANLQQQIMDLNNLKIKYEGILMEKENFIKDLQNQVKDAVDALNINTTNYKEYVDKLAAEIEDKEKTFENLKKLYEECLSFKDSFKPIIEYYEKKIEKGDYIPEPIKNALNSILFNIFNKDIIISRNKPEIRKKRLKKEKLIKKLRIEKLGPNQYQIQKQQKQRKPQQRNIIAEAAREAEIPMFGKEEEEEMEHSGGGGEKEKEEEEEEESFQIVKPYQYKIQLS